MIRFGSVVEGHGETRALPLLLRRIVESIDSTVHVEALPPIRRPRTLLLKEGGLEAAVEAAAIKLGWSGSIIVLLDADDDCPANSGPEFYRRVKRAVGDLASVVVLANREYEAWFPAAANSLRGLRRLRNDVTAPADPEAIRGAKEWVRARMDAGAPYDPRIDQARPTALMDLQLARGAPSFDRLYRKVEALVRGA